VEVPPARLADVDPAALARICAALGLATPPAGEPKVVDLGPRWLVLELADAAAVRALAPDLAAIAEASRALGITGVTAFGRARAADHALAVRSFAPAEAIPEDPVCGSGNAAIGVLLDAAGALPGAGREFVASQGRELGRDGYVTVRVDPETRRTWIGGHSVTCIDGTRPA
jgi:PhzF family phenazine biosynthesis protein